ALIEVFTNLANNNGEYHPTKLLYTLGNFSHFIRPEMKRVETTRSDALSLKDTYQDVVFSAYTNDEENQLVLVAVNFTGEARAVSLAFANEKTIKNPALFLTDDFSNLLKQDIDLSSQNLVVPARSVVTYTAGLEVIPTGISETNTTEFDAFLNQAGDQITTTFSSGGAFRQVMLYSVSGSLLQVKNIKPGQNLAVLSASDLPDGVYLVSGRGDLSSQTKKIIIAKDKP
ncbi:MAG TPA: T9SS type A sorting domain-containing protein, partial [Bacteroidales bacterium]|nr:T9SS type A sorting domain-containing protein [Bacteroidales bacterium]